ERRKGRGALFAAAVAIGLAVLLVVQLDHHRIETGLRAKQKVASTNVQTRLEAWSAAARLATDHPITGVGPGNFPVHYLAETGRPPGSMVLAVVHDTYLDVASE